MSEHEPPNDSEPEVERELAQENAHLRAELEAAEMVESTLGPAGGERWVPIPRARKLRDAVAAARRAALEEMLSRVPPTHLAVVGSALVPWAAR